MQALLNDLGKLALWNTVEQVPMQVTRLTARSRVFSAKP